MKKLLATLFVTALFTVSATAQEKRPMKRGHMQMHKHHRHMMAKQLNFSEDQKKQAKIYNEDFRKKMQDLNKNESITVKEQRDRKEALRKEQRTKMQGLLTPEQKTKMAQLKADGQKKKEEHFARHLDKMKITLNLTDAQVAQMRSQREATQLKMKAIRENESLSREERKSKMMALKAEAKEQHKKILTPEQLKKMEELKKLHTEESQVK
jgi:Spy/CpxP family protein refolding chaperone